MELDGTKWRESEGKSKKWDKDPSWSRTSINVQYREKSVRDDGSRVINKLGTSSLTRLTV